MIVMAARGGIEPPTRGSSGALDETISCFFKPPTVSASLPLFRHTASHHRFIGGCDGEPPLFTRGRTRGRHFWCLIPSLGNRGTFVAQSDTVTPPVPEGLPILTAPECLRRLSGFAVIVSSAGCDPSKGHCQRAFSRGRNTYAVSRTKQAATGNKKWPNQPIVSRYREFFDLRLSMPDIRSEQHSVVVLGTFNPIIVHPSWPPVSVLLNELWGVGPDEAEDVVIVREVSKFKVGSLTIQVEGSRFQILDDEPSAKRVARFAEALFTHELPHTPCCAIGLNYRCVVSCENMGVRDKIGYALAPPVAWGQYSDELRFKTGGMSNLTMRIPFDDESTVNEATAKYRLASVTAGVGTEDLTFSIKVNTHFGIANIKRVEDFMPTNDVLPGIINSFDDTMADSNSIAKTIINLAKSGS